MSRSGWLEGGRVCGGRRFRGGSVAVAGKLPRGLSDVRGFAGARVVGWRLCVAIFGGAKGFYMAVLCEGDVTPRSRLL